MTTPRQRTHGVGGFHFYNAADTSSARTLLMQISSAGTVTAAGDLSVSGNVWGATSPSTTPASASASAFSNGTTLNLTECTNGMYVCGIYMGHINNDMQYWTGARLALKCCAL